MDSGTFHQLHNTRYKHIFSIADSIYFYFFSADVFIYKYWFFLVDLYCSF